MRLITLVALLICLLAHAPYVRAQSVQAQDFACVIEARQTVKLANSALGMVADLKVDRGDTVRKGQVLGRLDDRVEAASLALAEAKATNDFDISGHQARLQWLRTKFARTDELSVTRLASRNSRDEAQSDMLVEEQQLRLAQLQRDIVRLEARQAAAQLDQRQIISPIDGVVVERLLSVGEYHNDQAPIMTLAEIDPLRVEVFLPTRFYKSIAEGSTAHVTPEAPIGGDFIASVSIVDKVIDAASGMFGVRLLLPNPGRSLPAGLKCTVRFDQVAH